VAEPLVPSGELLRRITDAECGYTVSRLRVLEGLTGNPVGVAYKRVGDAFALSARYLPNSSFNRVVALTDDRADDVPALIDWFESRNIAGRFEIHPGAACSAVMAALSENGYRHSEFHAVLYGRPQAAPVAPAGVTVEVVDPSTLDAFLDCYSAGWGVPDREGFKNNVRGWLGQPGWTLYLGRHSGKPAGGAILYMDGRTGYCADSAVDPAFRGHGVHRALLHQRSADAAASGADLLCAQAAYLSTSHRNMVRAGLGLFCTKAIWTRSTL
jgi:GNAT superfamily N-acetyltransferase